MIFGKKENGYNFIQTHVHYPLGFWRTHQLASWYTTDTTAMKKDDDFFSSKLGCAFKGRVKETFDTVSTAREKVMKKEGIEKESDIQVWSIIAKICKKERVWIAGCVYPRYFLWRRQKDGSKTQTAWPPIRKDQCLCYLWRWCRHEWKSFLSDKYYFFAVSTALINLENPRFACSLIVLALKNWTKFKLLNHCQAAHALFYGSLLLVPLLVELFWEIKNGDALWSSTKQPSKSVWWMQCQVFTWSCSVLQSWWYQLLWTEIICSDCSTQQISTSRITYTPGLLLNKFTFLLKNK